MKLIIRIRAIPVCGDHNFTDLQFSGIQRNCVICEKRCNTVRMVVEDVDVM